MPDPRFLNPITVLADIGGISIDVIDRRNENYEHIITQNPIEDGSPSTDHITNLPVKITLEGRFSDTPISNLVGPALTQQAILGRSKVQFDKLLELFVGRKLFSVMDGLHLLKNMQFKSLQEVKDREGFFVGFTAELWSIRTITVSSLGGFVGSISDVADTFDRLKTAPQLLLSVGAISTKDSLSSIGVLL